MKLFRIELKAKTEPKKSKHTGEPSLDPTEVYVSGPRGNVWIKSYSAFEAMSIFVQNNGPDIINRFDSMWLVADTDNPLTEEYFFFNNN